MTPERWHKVKAVLAEALELEGEARARLLARAGAEDPALRREVEDLLGAEEVAALVTSAVATEVFARSEPTSDLGRTVGPYLLEAEVGRGGMGTVYLARRVDGQYDAKVAVKLARGDVDAAQAAARFRLERQYLARLEHPFIARLLDGGVTADGRLYLAMEYVDGESIEVYCASHRLGLEERLRLFRKVCAAVEYAHQHLIVHRDLKCRNVLVAADGTAKLLDFGIAKLLDPLTEAGVAMTVDAGRFLTPGYASPEQRAGAPITTASDVYSLGVMLHEVLAGGLPRFEEAPEGAAGDGREPIPVSRAAALAGGLPGTRFVEARRLRGDVDRIVAKALRRDPEERYPSAAALDEDLRRYLDGEPIRARAPTFLYRARKFLRRNALAAGMTAALTLSLVSASLLYAYQARTTAQARSLAARRGEFLEKVLTSADPIAGRRDVTVAELLDGAAAQLTLDRGEEPLVKASMLGLLAETNNNLGRYPQAIEASDGAIALLRAHRGGPEPLADALMTRGDALRRSGRFDEGEVSLREALALLERVHPGQKRAQAYDLLGIALKQAGREQEAAEAYRSAIRLYGLLGERDRAKSAYPLSNLAVLRGEQGHYAEASALSAEALAVARKALPPDHPDVLAFESAYAGSLMGLHAVKEAEPLLRHVADARARVFGPEHKETLLSVTGLADCLEEEHRYAEAATLSRRAAEGLQRTVGFDDPTTLYAWNTYATAACETDQAGDGVAVLRRVEAARASRYGPGDWHIASTRVAIGGCLLTLGRLAEAEALLLRAARDLESARGPTFHRTQAAYRTLRDLYAQAGRAEEAARWGARLAPQPAAAPR